MKLDGLRFSALRAANFARLRRFKNAQGQPAHSKPDGSDWSDAQWLQAVVGELGEYANLKKKEERGDFVNKPVGTITPLLADELADAIIYLDILAFRLGIDLGDAVQTKFNRKSSEQQVGVYITPDGDDVKVEDSK